MWLRWSKVFVFTYSRKKLNLCRLTAASLISKDHSTHDCNILYMSKKMLLAIDKRNGDIAHYKKEKKKWWGKTAVSFHWMLALHQTLSHVLTLLISLNPQSSVPRWAGLCIRWRTRLRNSYGQQVRGLEVKLKRRVTRTCHPATSPFCL